jgi:hypothetical protein
MDLINYQVVGDRPPRGNIYHEDGLTKYKKVVVDTPPRAKILGMTENASRDLFCLSLGNDHLEW